YFAKSRKISERRCNQSTSYWATWDLHGRSYPAFGADHIWPGSFTDAADSRAAGRYHRRSSRDRFEHSYGGGGGAEPGGCLSHRRHREIRGAQHNRPADEAAAGDGLDRQPEHRQWRGRQRHTQSAWFAAQRNVGSHRWKARCDNWWWHWRRRARHRGGG